LHENIRNAKPKMDMLLEIVMGTVMKAKRCQFKVAFPHQNWTAVGYIRIIDRWDNF